jgi:hypothetical protein
VFLEGISKKCNSEKKRKKIYLIAILCLAILSIFAYSHTGVDTEKIKMEHYLKERYGKDFKVSNVRKVGYGIGVKGTILADAELKDGGTEKFMIRRWGETGYLDEYPSTIYNNRERPELDKFIRELSVKPSRYSVDININPEIYNEVRDVPKLVNLLKDYAKEVDYGVKVIVQGDSPTNNNINDVKKLASYTALKNPKKSSVRYVINSKDGTYRYICQYYNESSSTSIQVNEKCFTRSEGVE